MIGKSWSLIFLYSKITLFDIYITHDHLRGIIKTMPEKL